MSSLRSLAFIRASAMRRARALSCASFQCSPEIIERKIATKIATRIDTQTAAAMLQPPTNILHVSRRSRSGRKRPFVRRLLTFIGRITPDCEIWPATGTRPEVPIAIQTYQWLTDSSDEANLSSPENSLNLYYGFRYRASYPLSDQAGVPPRSPRRPVPFIGRTFDKGSTSVAQSAQTTQQIVIKPDLLSTGLEYACCEAVGCGL